ncbi:anthranilate phosphoribosyltransferase [Desulforamulus hydrothermalis]|uniref:Anthranilate phosphoribosyltransferase n=1 Tax=Desulforamulus hydrothermalis Lam5 = DSM 18033 TaxID=1121428 RepID=K8EC72_9FIRM|nr:anthranilate phosphoribosyltransferase [Desulforamulus hydrothermalis]CCO09288.1 Anthranilate phosphoribosyltransferase [Desulforamulus hydrothermalis Lam5 = DSM 18033]SHH04862.1 anthranilate phosphoribosyltransferase [Desulforamulus hydrothermalis Lam5 = DSM 18033]
MITEAIKQVVKGEDLSEPVARGVMQEIMTGEASPAQIACFLTALHLKGETAAEITGFARTMREKLTPVKTGRKGLVDTCGTGGDGAHTFNISTASALVLAGAGLPVAKHGNRSVSSRCGSADVLEYLGVAVNLTPAEAGLCLDEVGIAFLYAPLLHTAMKYAAGPRQEMGIRTVFNILGPLTNPAFARHQVLGVYSAQLAPVMARVLANLGTAKSFVIHGSGGLDEISLAGPALVYETEANQVRQFTLDPLDFGLARAPVAALAGGDVKKNARILQNVLAGAPGPQRDAVIINAALGLVAGGLTGDLAAAVKLAQEVIDSGRARQKLKQLIEFSQSLVRERTAAL